MADKTINDMTEATVLDQSDLLEIENTGGNSRKAKVSTLRTAAGFHLIFTYDQAIDGNLSTIPFSVAGYDEVLIELIDLTNSSSIQRGIQISVDGGSNYYTTGTDYAEFGASGATANNACFFPHSTASGSARSSMIRMHDISSSRTPKMANLINRAICAQFQASSSPITHMRVMGSSGGSGTPAGTYNGGKVRVWAR